MKIYILIDPFTNKPICFSELIITDDITNSTVDANGNRVFEKLPTLCLEVDYDPALLNKTYNPLTQTFVD